MFPTGIKSQSVVVEADGAPEREAGIETRVAVLVGSSLWVWCLQTLSHSCSSPLGWFTSLFPLHEDVGVGSLLFTTRRVPGNTLVHQDEWNQWGMLETPRRLSPSRVTKVQEKKKRLKEFSGQQGSSSATFQGPQSGGRARGGT